MLAIKAQNHPLNKFILTFAHWFARDSDWNLLHYCDSVIMWSQSAEYLDERYRECRKSLNSPKHTVSCKWIAFSCTVTWTAAVLMKAPVAHHTPVAVRSTYSRLADAVSIGRVTRRAVGQVEGAQMVTVACWESKKWNECVLEGNVAWVSDLY